MYQICVSGASKGESVDEGRKLAESVGRVLAKSGHALMTGATIGLPNIAAEAYKAAGGNMSLGISPAATKIEHVLKYRLPTKAYDTILFSGLHYIGRDMLMVNSADAVLSIGGRIGTLHEFTIAMETDTPIGFLEGGGGVSTEIVDILHAAGESKSENVVFDGDADKLLDKIIDLLNKQNKKYSHIYE